MTITALNEQAAYTAAYLMFNKEGHFNGFYVSARSKAEAIRIFKSKGHKANYKNVILCPLHINPHV